MNSIFKARKGVFALGALSVALAGIAPLQSFAAGGVFGEVTQVLANGQITGWSYDQSKPDSVNTVELQLYAPQLGSETAGKAFGGVSGNAGERFSSLRDILARKKLKLSRDDNHGFLIEIPRDRWDNLPYIAIFRGKSINGKTVRVLDNGIFAFRCAANGSCAIFNKLNFSESVFPKAEFDQIKNEHFIFRNRYGIEAYYMNDRKMFCRMPIPSFVIERAIIGERIIKRSQKNKKDALPAAEDSYSYQGACRPQPTDVMSDRPDYVLQSNALSAGKKPLCFAPGGLAPELRECVKGNTDSKQYWKMRDVGTNKVLLVANWGFASANSEQCLRAPVQPNPFPNPTIVDPNPSAKTKLDMAPCDASDATQLWHPVMRDPSGKDPGDREAMMFINRYWFEQIPAVPDSNCPQGARISGVLLSGDQSEAPQVGHRVCMMTREQGLRLIRVDR